MQPLSWSVPVPALASSFDWSDWTGIVGTVIGALLGFGLSFLQRRSEEERTSSRQATAAAHACLDGLRSIDPSRPIGDGQLAVLAADVAAYRAAMLSTKRTRERHASAYAAVRDVLSGFDDTSLKAAIASIDEAL